MRPQRDEYPLPEVPMNCRQLLLPAGLVLALAAPARAQFAPGTPDEADTPLDAATRSRLFPFLPAAAGGFTRKEWVDIPEDD